MLWVMKEHWNNNNNNNNKKKNPIDFSSPIFNQIALIFALYDGSFHSTFTAN